MSDNVVVLSVDSSREAAGMILSQLSNDGKIKHPAHYGSLPMGETESRYSQPKLELYRLFKALQHWQIYIIGVKKLIVEVDAKYIKGMLNNLDLQPNATINCWIQGIKLFDFELVHVPADKHRGPDALSRRPLAEGEIVEEEDDSWLDEIDLFTFIPTRDFSPFPKIEHQDQIRNNVELSCYSAQQTQNNTIQAICEFHSKEVMPVMEKIQTKKCFLSKCGEFFLKGTQLYKKNGSKTPLLVIMEPDHKNSILLHAHENLEH